MARPFTTRFSDDTYALIQRLSLQLNAPRNRVIEQAVQELDQRLMAEQIKLGLQQRQEEYTEMAEEFYDAQSSSLQD